LYPIGATPAAYNPLVLTNTGTADHFTIAVNDQVIPGGVLQSGIQRTWLVSEGTPGGSNIDLSLRWAGPEELSMFDNAHNELIRSDGSDIVQSSTTAAAVGANPFSRSAGGFSVLTLFSVASYAKLLPVPLSAFNAQLVNPNTAMLYWKADNLHKGGTFTVQKATGTTFTDIGIVNQEAGKWNYNFTDYRLSTGINEYRLKITAPGLDPQYSKIVQVANAATGLQMELRPSVTNKEETILYMTLPAKDFLSILIVDAMGRVQSAKSVQLDKGKHYLPLQLHKLSPGIYYVEVSGNTAYHQSLRLIKQ
jgi:hypothetical protein